ncbi:hypothetical protein ABZ990_24130 [Streptomyces sp. NPDC046203]|uniref:hypothetical protein n=1 Tax=Streptomyces sp. NPDC046203 TaxID=3154602 RepID=UPI0033D3D68C
MTLRTLFRTSAALWTAPVWLGIVFLYFFYPLHIHASHQEVVDGPLWAPAQVAVSLSYFYAFAYSITLGLAVWEGGRLKQDRVWELAPSRSRFRVAGRALAPSLGAGWAILLLPVLMRMVETGLVPTPTALLPLFMGLGIVGAYAVVGCALGRLAPRAIAAPFGAVAAFYLVNKTSTYSPPVWPRHVSGQLDTSVTFGERLSLVTVLVPFLFAAAVAVAVAAWWITGPRRALWRSVAAAVALATLVASAWTASGWGIAGGPVSAGHAPARCTGSAPRVCMAETGGRVERLDAVREEVIDSFQRLKASGVEVVVPATVTDELLYEREATRPRSTATTWWLPLTAQAARKDGDLVGVRYAVLRDAVIFPCSMPVSFAPGASADWAVHRDAARLWAAHSLDLQDRYLHERAGQYAQFAHGPEVLAKVKERAAQGLTLPTARERAAWFEEEKATACRLAPKAAGQGVGS